MSIFSLFTQGGQTQLHQLRMLRQVTWTTLVASFLIGAIAFGYEVLSCNTSYDFYRVYSYYLADLKLSMPFAKPHLVRQQFRSPQGKSYEASSLEIMQAYDIRYRVAKFHWSLRQGLKVAAITSLISLILMACMWIIRGKANKQKKLLSGAEIVPSKTLKRLIKQQRKVSSLTLGGIPLLKGEETKHMLISGTTGAGKTNCFHELLPQIRQSGQRAIIVDLTGDFVAKYYEADKDIILNPLDQRSKGWDLWAECEQLFHFDDLATALIPEQMHEAFWTVAARMVLAATLRKTSEEPTRDIRTLYSYLTELSLKDLERFFAGTEAAGLINTDSDKTAASIRATLTTAIRALRYLKNMALEFSIRQ